MGNGFKDSEAGTTLQRRLVFALGQRIVLGEIAEGEIISTDAIQKDYSVSRTVVREALRALEVRGLVRARPRVGTVVQPRTSWTLLDPIVIEWRGQGPDAQEQFRELMLLREAIEPIAAREAAMRVSDSQIAELRAALDEMRDAAQSRNTARFGEADTAFHQIINAASGSMLVSQLLGSLEAALHSRYSLWNVAFDATTELSLDRHEQLWVAISERDTDAAATVARQLIHEARVEVLGDGFSSKAP